MEEHFARIAKACGVTSMAKGVFQKWKDFVLVVWQRECIQAQQELSTNAQAHDDYKFEYDGHAMLCIWVDSFDIVTTE